MTICFFEHNGDRIFAPLTLTRPVDDLRIGVFTIREKWQRYLQTEQLTRIPREPVSKIFPGVLPEGQGDIIWINARWLPDSNAAAEVRSLEAGERLVYGGHVVAIRLSTEESLPLFKHPETGFDPNNGRKTVAGSLISHLWDLFQQNEAEINKDIALLKSTNPVSAPGFPQAILINPDDIYAEKGAKVDPGAVIDASAGPVYLGRDSHVMFGAVIQGPGSVGEQSTVKMGANVYRGTTIGPVCKVNGEINNVIFHSHSNKGHDGFIGNSLIGEWCNLGANTITSNLKNNYKPIRLPNWTDGVPQDTSQQFIGTVMGDLGRTAINTTLSAGTMCGVCTNIVTTGFPPQHIPSFSWVTDNGVAPYLVDKAIETAEIIMQRRDIRMSQEYRDAMHTLFAGR